MSDDLTRLLREMAPTFSTITLRHANGHWKAAVTRHTGALDQEGEGDPVAALRAAVIEDDRQERDRLARYKAALASTSPRRGGSGDDSFEDFL